MVSNIGTTLDGFSIKSSGASALTCTCSSPFFRHSVFSMAHGVLRISYTHCDNGGYIGMRFSFS
jgi:hypothetical protein